MGTFDVVVIDVVDDVDEADDGVSENRSRIDWLADVCILALGVWGIRYWFISCKNDLISRQMCMKNKSVRYVLVHCIWDLEREQTEIELIRYHYVLSDN